MKDFLRPHTEPARSIYDAFQDEAKKRPGRTFEEWHQAEIRSVFLAAVQQSGYLGLTIPTVDDVISAEHLASGHADYGAKWAIGVADMMRQPRE